MPNGGKHHPFGVFDPSQEAQCAFLSTLLQTWLWPYKNSPTAYGQYLVLDRIYPFADPERLLSLVEMLETEMCRTSCVSCRFTPTPIIRR